MKKFLIFAFGVLLFSSCEEVPVEINDVVIEPTEKVVLVEELTGASCPNCPKGTKVIENIIEKYPKNVVAVGIHGSFLANPLKSGDPDFRSEEGKNLENWFKPWFGKPSASINRTKTEIASTLYYVHLVPDLWESVVEDELQKPLQLNLFMDVKYDENTRKINMELGANPLEDIDGDYNITIYVVESHIIAAQANGTETILEYEHNHVLRKVVTNYQGDFFASDFTKGQIIKKNFSYTLPEEDGVLNIAENTSLVAFIHKSGSNEREILQTVSKHLIQ